MIVFGSVTMGVLIAVIVMLAIVVMLSCDMTAGSRKDREVRRIEAERRAALRDIREIKRDGERRMRKSVGRRWER